MNLPFFGRRSVVMIAIYFFFQLSTALAFNAVQYVVTCLNCVVPCPLVWAQVSLLLPTSSYHIPTNPHSRLDIKFLEPLTPALRNIEKFGLFRFQLLQDGYLLSETPKKPVVDVCGSVGIAHQNGIMYSVLRLPSTVRNIPYLPRARYLNQPFPSLHNAG